MPRITRRAMLITAGATATVIAGAGITAWYPGTASATEPWRKAGQSLGDPRLDALAYAILAPNPHNRQPWTFTLVGRDRIDIDCDLARRLPHTDPFDRQIVIGFGCMIELLRIAAAERGYTALATAFPDGEPQPRLDGKRIASVVFYRDPATARDPFAAHLLARRSIKTVYNETPVEPRHLAAIAAAAGPAVAAGGTVDPDRTRRLVGHAWDAWMIEYETARTRRESVDLMRIGNTEVAANPDGIELGGMAMGAAAMAGLITRDALDTPGSGAYQQGIDMFDAIIHSARGFVWLISPANNRIDQLAAGRAWVRMNLAATAAEVALHPLSQALQEFSEMAAPFDAVHSELGARDGRVVQMFGRIGHASPVDPTPRWNLESRLIA